MFQKYKPSSTVKIISILSILILLHQNAFPLSSDFNSLITHPNTVQGEDTTSLKANNTDGSNSFEVQTDGDVTIGVNRTATTVQVKSPATFDSSIFFEGSSDDTFETELRPTNATADNVIVVPTASGTMAISATSPIQLSASGNISYGGAGGFGPGDLDLTADYTWTGTHRQNGPAHFIGDAVTDSLTITSAIQGNLIMDGATDDTVETTLTFNTSSSDRTITFPDATGTVQLTSTTLTEGSVVFAGSGGVFTEDNANLFYNDTSNTLHLLSDLEFEGSSINDFETTITATNPTADRTITLPNAGGTVAVSASSPVTLSAAGDLDLDETADFNFTGTNFTIGNAITDNLTITSAIQGATGACWDGSTNNTNETCFAFVDPTADRTVTFPNADLDFSTLTSPPNQIIKAWAGFTGTGTPTMQDSFNMDASITDNGAGDWTVSFTTDFANDDYAVICSGTGGVGSELNCLGPTPTVGTARLVTSTAGGAAADCTFCSLIAMGDQ